MNKKLNLTALSLILSSSLFVSVSANASAVLYSEDTETQECTENEIYMGPNRPGRHWGSCVGLSVSYNGTENLNDLSGNAYTQEKSIYTRDKNSCASIDMTYVGPWDSAKHGGFCVHGSSYPVRDRDCGAARFPMEGGKELQIGTAVYVGPHDAGKHGGYCYSFSQ